MDILNHFRRLFEYEEACTRKVVDSLHAAKAHLESAGVAPEAAPFIRAVEIFSHIQAARRVWLSRLGAAEWPDDGVFPSWSLQKAGTQAPLMDSLWLDYAKRLTLADLDRRVEYTATEGLARSAMLRDILTHVVNHSTYHRGQIARLVAECLGPGKAAVTDFIIFALEHP